MKKLALTLLAVVAAAILFCQTPQAFKYQTVIRDNTGQLIVNQNVSFRISILQGSTTGAAVYIETHDTITNEQGMVSLEIGNGNLVSGMFANINWGGDSYFLQVEIDETGGSNYEIMGTTQLLSVPFALYAASTGDTSLWRKNGDNIYYNKGKVGIGTENPGTQLDVNGNSWINGPFYIGKNDSSESIVNIFNAVSDWELVASPNSNSLLIRKWNGSPTMSLTGEGSVGVGTSSIEESALMELNSTTKGFLLPTMTTEQIVDIHNPANGLQVYNIDNGKLYIFVTSLASWQEISYGTTTLPTTSSFEIGLGGTCENIIVNGYFEENRILTSYEYVGIEVNVISVGDYSVVSDTVNGYYFSTSGTFTSNGIQTINLLGTGTPVNIQTDVFTVTASNNGGTCIFSIDVLPKEWHCRDTIEYNHPGFATQVYNTVLIGNQCWFQDNLNIGYGINGSEEMTDDGIIEKYCYDDAPINCFIYGGLYQWDEMMNYVTDSAAQGICPNGWHIPTAYEYNIMIDYLGGVNIAGGKMKETGTLHWLSPNTGATNESGFTGLPGGIRYHMGEDPFEELGEIGHYWTSTFGSIQLTYDDDDAGIGVWVSWYGHSVRCLKD